MKKVFDAEEMYDSQKKNFSLSREKFLKSGSLWIMLMEGGRIERSYNHIAFDVQASQLSVLRRKIKEAGLELREERSRFPEEGESIYFYDLDNHLFEFHAGNLEDRVKFYRHSESNGGIDHQGKA